MSTARNALLVSASLLAAGIAGAMLADGDVDLLQQAESVWSKTRTRIAAPPPSPAPPSIAEAPAPRVVVPTPEAVVVTISSANSTPVAPRLRPAVGDHLSLAQELQSELQRVGCYAGSIDGVWSPLAKEAMKSFMQRVNAQLPVNEPDYVHLALVKGRQDKVCVKQCPAGHSLTADNACVAAKSVPERAMMMPGQPALAPPSTLPAEAAAQSAVDGGIAPPAPAPQAPGQLALAPGTTPAATTPKTKAASTKPAPGSFGPDIFRSILRMSP